MAHVRVATALVEEKGATSKSSTSTSSRHCTADLIGLCIAGSPRSRRRSTSPEREPLQPPIYVPTSTRTDVVVTPAATSTNIIASARSGSSDVASTTTVSTVL
jgi:hypothetical protein